MNDALTLTACLKRLSWSPERLAREINRSRGEGTISDKAPYNWLKGSVPRREIPHVVAGILSEKLGEPVTVRDLWPDKFGAALVEKAPIPVQRSSAEEFAHGSPDDRVTTAVDWLVGTAPSLAGQARGEEADPGIVAELEARSVRLRRLDDERGGRLVMDWAVQELCWARKLIAECSYDRETELRLHRAAAELAQLAGWMAVDLGMPGRSERYLLAALRSAHTAGDRALAGHIISCLSYRSTWNGHGQEALRLVQIARKGTEERPAGPDQALLASRQARAYAALGDTVGCGRSLEEAQELIGDGDTSHAPPWSHWVTPAVLVADAGRAWLDVGRTAWAEHHLEQGLKMFGDSQPRNRLLHWTSLAEARLVRGDVDGAVTATEGALDLYEQVTSERARTRLVQLRERFLQCDAMVARQIGQRTTEALNDAPRTLAPCG